MANTLNFESALLKLEDIVAKLEKGESSLDESIALFEDGVKMAKLCNTYLNKAKMKIITLDEAEVDQ